MQTGIFKEKIYQAETIEEFDMRLIEYMNEVDLSWEENLKKCLKENNLTPEQLRQKCTIKLEGTEPIPVSKPTFRKWVKQPPERLGVIAICMSLNLTLEETNRMLERFARKSTLYVKNPDDTIFIFLIEKGYDFVEYFEYREYFNTIIDNSQKDNNEVNSIATGIMSKEILKTRNLKQFIDENIDGFYERNKMLDQYIRSELLCDDISQGINGYLKIMNGAKEEVVFPISRFLSKLKSLSQSSVIADRDDLIALGVNLNFSVDSINKILYFTYNEELCPKHICEAIIIYTLTELEACCPEVFADKSTNMRDGTSIFDQLEEKLTETEFEVLDILKSFDEKDMLNLVPNYIVYRAAQTSFNEDFMESELLKKIVKNLKFVNEL